MNKRQPYNSIIERKLEQLPAVDADQLWNDMHSILDKKMPQKKERRRFILWFLMSKPFLFLTIGFVIGSGTSIFFLSGKKSSTAIISNLPDSQQADKLNENNVSKISEKNKENIKSNNETQQEDRENLPATISSTNLIDPVVNKNFVAVKTRKQSEKNITVKDQASEQFIEATLSISKTRPDFDIATANLNSDYQDILYIKNSIQENNFLT